MKYWDTRSPVVYWCTTILLVAKLGYYYLIGEHAELLNEFHLQDVRPGRVEMDELWTFIQKKQKL